MRLAYVVSRFPVASETFIVREMTALEEHHGAEIDLLALFAPDRRFVHPEAAAWVPRLRRPGSGAGARALGRWLVRRPGATLGLLARVVADHAAHPARLVRALATVPLACAHALHVEREGLQHVHAHFATYPALTAWVCRRLTGSTYSLTAHAHDLFVEQSHLRTVVGEASFVVAISEYNRRFLRDYGGDVRTPVHVVRCGLEPDRYAFRPRSLPSSGPIRALCVASLEEYKGHRYLLQALAEGAGLERLQLDLVGEGSLRGELEALAERLGLAGRVRFLGAQDEAQVAGLLDAAELFALPSVVAGDGQMEGLPVALMEALAAGVPTVATRLSGIPELVEDGVTGLLAAPGDPRSLAVALRRTLADPDAARDRAVAGRRRVEAEYDLGRTAAHLAGLFEGVSARAGARAAPA